MNTYYRNGLAALAITLSSASGALTSDIVVVVSAKSPVTALSANQVADIFLGKVSRFPDGNQAVAIDQMEDSVARERFYAQFTGKSTAQVKSHWSKIIFTGRGQPPRQVANSVEARKLVAQNPNAVGYIESHLVDASVRVLDTK